MQKRALVKSIALALATGTLVACGGGGGSDSGTTATSVTTVGTITGFGSVYVNGVKFETDSSSYRVDDDDAFDDSSLAIGMKVKIKGEVNADGSTGTAYSIEYDDDIEGPVANLVEDTILNIKTFEVFGLSIQAELGKTIFDDMTYAELSDGDIVEVSGYYDGSVFIATYIEDQDTNDDDELEVKGTVSAYSPGVSVTVDMLNGVSQTFDVDGSTELDFSGDLVGQFVEVKIDANTLVATEIETDDDGYLDDDDDDVKLRGFLVYDGSGYRINGIPLLISEDAEIDDSDLALADLVGMTVEVEGYMRNGVLVVDEIEFEDGDIELEGDFGSVTGSGKEGSVTVEFGNAGYVTVTSTNGTMIHDDDQALNLEDLTALVCPTLEIEAYRADGGDLIATSIECDDDVYGEYKVEGPLDSWSDSSSLTVLGVTFTVDGSTSYEDDVDAATFFGGLSTGVMIEIDDDNRDGIADEVELDD